MSRLQGAALSFLMGLAHGWASSMYQELKETLVAHFKGARTMAQAKLQALVCGKDVVAFSEKFTELAAAATQHMGTEWIKSLYVSKVPAPLRMHLRSFHELPLQQLVTKATHLSIEEAPPMSRPKPEVARW